jgi:hypothetical protein
LFTLFPGLKAVGKGAAEGVDKLAETMMGQVSGLLIFSAIAFSGPIS